MFEQWIWVIPGCVLAAGLWRPWAGLTALTASLALYGTPPGGPYLASLELAGLAAVATAWRARRPAWSALDWTALAFLVASLVSLAPLAWSPPSWQPRVLAGLVRALPEVETWTLLYTWRATLNLLLGFGLYLAVRRAFAGRSPRPLGLALAAGLALLLVLGLASHLELVDLWAYRAIDRANYLGRLHSLFFHSGWLAEFLVVTTPVAAAALLTGRRWLRLLACALVALVLTVLPFTQARGAWVAAAAQLLVLAAALLPRLRSDRRLARRLAAVALVGVVLLAALLALRPSLAQPVLRRAAAFNLSGRTLLWRDALSMTGERPLLGWGLGSFNPVYDWRRPRLSPGAVTTSATPHNLYLSVSAERGLVGLAALVLMGLAALNALRRARAQDDGSRRRLAAGLAVAFVGWAVYGLVQYMLFLKMMEWLFWILLGMLASLAQGSGPGEGRLRRGAQALVVLALLLLPVRLLSCEPPPGEGRNAIGIHEREWRGERSWRWTAGWAALRTVRQGDVLVLELANGHPRADEHRIEVEIRFDGSLLGRLEPVGRWQEYRLAVPAGARRDGVLEITTRPSFRPFTHYPRWPELPLSFDVRRLGVAVGSIDWRQDASEQSRRP